MPPPSASRARNASTPPRIATITSPTLPGRIAPVAVTRPWDPIGDELAVNALCFLPPVIRPSPTEVLTATGRGRPAGTALAEHEVHEPVRHHDRLHDVPVVEIGRCLRLAREALERLAVAGRRRGNHVAQLAVHLHCDLHGVGAQHGRISLGPRVLPNAPPRHQLV